MNIIITNPAKSSLRKLYNYYKLNASAKFAEKIRSELIASITKLESYPNVGQIEEQLAFPPLFEVCTDKFHKNGITLIFLS